MNKNKILKIIDELSNNAMFAISLTSKELFHTNLWAWMLRKYPNIFTPVFYPKYDGNGKIEVFREKYNFDLLIKIGDEYIIIENKFKSAPNKEQLEKYYKKIKTEKKKVVLISYFKPLFMSALFDLEEYISYETLYLRMSKVFFSQPESMFKGNDWFLINDYIEFLYLLNQFNRYVSVTENDKIEDLWAVIKDEDIQKELSKINFTKTFERVFMTKLTQIALDKFKYSEFIDNIRIDCGQDLKVFSDILFHFPGTWDKNENKRQDLCYLGISLWGDEYRYYAGLHKSQCGIDSSKNSHLDKENKIAGFKYLSDNYAWLFGQEDFCKWNGYSCESEMYLYKRINISKYSVKELSEKVIHDLELIYFYIEPMRNENVEIK